MRRVDVAEWLDDGAHPEEEIEASLRDLARINRWLGGVATAEWLLQAIARQSGMREISVLDVASGRGDVSARAAAHLRLRGIDVKLTALDHSDQVLRRSEVKERVVGDALALPFRDRSFDVVTCCLFAHHLTPEALQRFIREARRIARAAVCINDLRRSRAHLVAVCAGLPIFSRITRHDAVASVRRAYTLPEMRTMLHMAAPGARIQMHRRLFFRMGAIVWM